MDQGRRGWIKGGEGGSREESVDQTGEGADQRLDDR